MTEYVQGTEAEGVLSVTLNRPDALNAFRPEMLEAMRDAISGASDGVKVAMIEGTGRAFSAGVDLKVLQEIVPSGSHGGSIGDVFDRPAREFGEAVRAARFPVIAKVHGFCFTGALEIALHCDMMFTTLDTKFGDTHAKFGIRPTWGMAQNLSRAIGLRRARELSYTARTITGEEALAWGLANAAAADKDALDALVAERCAQIAGNSPGAIAAIKDLYRVADAQLGIEESLAEERRRKYEISDSAERLAGFGR